jgi:hypothetical protein
MAHDLSDGIKLQAGALDMFRPFGIDIGSESSKDRLVQGREIVARHRLAGRDGDVVPAIHAKDTAAHGTITSCAVAALPAHNRNGEAGEQIRMAGQYPETPRSVFGAHGKNSVFIDDDRERRNDA